MSAYSYYNEIDPFAAAWLRELIAAGHIANGFVDERSIEDVKPSELAGFTQCHFFAGIGGWSYALRLAGWPDDQPVWTGSCPCQPFSTAGKGVGFADERHLWPAFFHLIEQRRPSIVFGEQVAGKAGLGWLDLVSADLEVAGYAVGAANIGAHSVGAPHMRQRLYWVGDSDSERVWQQPGSGIGAQSESRDIADRYDVEPSGAVGTLGHSYDTRSQGRVVLPECYRGQQTRPPNVGLADTDRNGQQARGGRREAARYGQTAWANCSTVSLRDGTSRPIGSGIQPLAHGVPARVGRLRGYGNAIVPAAAAAFIQAVTQCT